MKEYRLIKKYPGLPKDWEVGMIVGTGDRQGLACFSPCSGEYTDKHIDHNDVINNPEFWEEVVEKAKEYEILSFYAKNIGDKDEVNKHYIWYETSKGSNLWSRMQNITSPYTTEEILKNKNYAIHSVRRLSDGEVFTIGDEINFNNIGTGKLLEIQFEVAPIDKGTGRLCFVHNHKTLGRWWNINELSKVNSVLFTTVDGVDIREGDDFYEANLKHGITRWTTEYFVIYMNENIAKTLFSTKEKAEEYILLNKPCLSINDVEFLKNECHVYWNEKLKKLVKSRW